MHTHKQYWQLAEAKNRFSELARLALNEGPQKIARRDGNLIIISETEYRLLKEKQPDFKEFLLNATPNLSDLDLRRDKSSMREVEL